MYHFCICPVAPRGRPRQCPGTPLYVKNQSRQIASKLVPLERAQKSKHFTCKNFGLEMNRSKVILILIWSRDQPQKIAKKHTILVQK